MTLYDSYGRPLLNLRVIVTDECNYRCVFCHIEGEPLNSPIPPGLARSYGYLSVEDYSVVAEASKRVGIRKIKFTGGEPLLREELPEIIRVFDERGFDDLSLTTNGFFLDRKSLVLRESGLDRLNVSLHTLRPTVYKLITGVNAFGKVLKGLEAALNEGFRQVKINAVIMKGLNDGEVPELIEFASKKGAVLQLIELHPVGMARDIFEKYYLPLEEIEKYLESRASRVEVRRDLHNRPIYVMDNGVRVEVVRPYNNWRFCLGCTRIRISPRGELFPCLNWFGERPSIHRYMNGARSMEEKVDAVVRAIKDVNKLRRPFYKPPSSHDVA